MAQKFAKKSAGSLANDLRGNEKIEILDLENSTIESGAFKDIARTLKTHPTITTINLKKL